MPTLELKMHLERYRGEGVTTCCGRDADRDELAILDEERAYVWVPGIEEEGDVCKVCLSTTAGRESLRNYRQQFQLREEERNWTDAEVEEVPTRD